MSDIVDRLRRLLVLGQDVGEVMEEAAAEIERLRATKIQPVDQDLRNNLRLARDANDRLTAEIERLRGTAVRDNCVSGNQPEIPSPVTEPMPKEKLAEVSAEPVAWAVERSDCGSLMGFCHTKRDASRFAHAIINDTKSEHFMLRHVPLYRQPQPTLTDAEREAVAEAECFLRVSRVAGSLGYAAATLRGLLERTCACSAG